MRRPTTPGAGGYLLAVLVSIAVTVVLLALTSTSLAAPLSNPGRFVAALLVLTVYVTVFAIPAAPLGVLLVHVCCRHVAAQWVHVLAAGVVGVLTGVTFGAVAAGMAGVLPVGSLTLILAVATAVGRACVIPLVLRPRPVDNDFPAGGSRC